MPREYFAKDPAFQCEYDALDGWLPARTQNTASTYTYNTPHPHGHQYCRHIRNAVAHGHVTFRAHDVIIFEDENRGQTFHTELPLADFTDFVNTKLLSVHLKVIKAINAKM